MISRQKKVIGKKREGIRYRMRKGEAVKDKDEGFIVGQVPGVIYCNHRSMASRGSSIETEKYWQTQVDWGELPTINQQHFKWSLREVEKSSRSLIGRK